MPAEHARGDVHTPATRRVLASPETGCPGGPQWVAAKTRPRRGRRGFTLLELMVALTTGAIVVGSLYYVGAGSSHVFQQQERIAQLQTSLQLAMNQIKRDVVRAGLFASANSQRARPSFCPPTGDIVALAHQDSADTNLIPRAAEHGVEADRLTVIGNLLTSDEYYAAAAVGGRIRLQRAHQGFRRSFTQWWDQQAAAGEIDAARVRDVFRANRWLRIRRPEADGYEFYVRVADVGDGSGVANIPPPNPIATDLVVQYALPAGGTLNAGGACMPDICLGCRIAPLAQVRYQVVEDIGAGSETAAQANAVTGTVTQLIRREIDPSTGDALAGTADRVVLENVVELDVQFMVAVNGNANNVQVMNTVTAQNVVDVRSVLVTLSARTPEQDGSFPWQPRSAQGAQNQGPLTRFRFTADRPGAAHVRTLRAEIPVDNLALQRRP